jgi:hypothetical protein
MMFENQQLKISTFGSFVRRDVFQLGCLALIACLGLGQAQARGNELLRWKFEVGQKYRVELVQNSSTLTEYETKSSNLSTETRLELSWEVVAVEAGVATVSQRLERLGLQLDLPTADGAGKVLFDSTDPSVSLNVKSELQARLQALVGTRFQVKLREDGQIVAVEAAPESLAAWQAVSGSPAFREQLSPQGLAKLFADSSLSLPQDQTASTDGWVVADKLDGPWGELSSETKYRLAGEQNFEGRPATMVVMERKIEPGVQSKPASAAVVAEAARLREHEARGEWYFDAGAGQLLGGKVNQRVESERTYREETMKTVYRSSTALRMQRLN